jgi:hypothetical protein
MTQLEQTPYFEECVLEKDIVRYILFAGYGYFISVHTAL